MVLSLPLENTYFALGIVGDVVWQGIVGKRPRRIGSRDPAAPPKHDRHKRHILPPPLPPLIHNPDSCVSRDLTIM